MSNRIEARLKGYRSPDVFNPWGQVCPQHDASQYNATRRWANLQTHFECGARYLLIGEAPGYRGCRYSGIPFTSEAQLMRGEVPGFVVGSRLTTFTQPSAEASATIVWRTLRALDIDAQTVLWNAFPFHPHLPDKPLSNRTPTRAELADCSDILGMVLDHYRGAALIAVGQKASDLLRLLGATGWHTVRHPANGGARDFAGGLREILKAFL